MKSLLLLETGFFFLCRWLSGHNPISLLLLLLLHQLADSISSSSSFARELWWCSFGALWNSVELDVTRTGNGRARVCVCVRSQPGRHSLRSFTAFLFLLQPCCWWKRAVDQSACCARWLFVPIPIWCSTEANGNGDGERQRFHAFIRSLARSLEHHRKWNGTLSV